MSARVLGAFNVAVSLTLAVITALSLTDLANDRLRSGLALLGTVLIARWSTSAIINEWNSRAARSVRGFWRRRTFDHLLIPRSEGERSRGDIATAIDHASDGPALEVLSTSARLSVVGLVLVYWSVGWLSTLITVTLMAAAVPLYQRAGTRSEVLAVEYEQRRALLTARELELLSHAPELRALGAIEYGADEVAAISDSEHRIAMRAIRVALESSLVTEFLSGVSIGLVAMVVGFGLLEGHLRLEHALIAVLVTSDIFLNIRRFGVEFHRRENALRSSASLASPRSLSFAETKDVHLRASKLVTPSNPIELTFDVVSGERLLITGASGSGKTTLLHTLLGWRPPRSGSAQRSRCVIGYVSAESMLLSGSLWDNLTLGEDIAKNLVNELLEQCGLSGERFSDLNAPVLADGRGFSSGERARIVLIRCLLAHPAVLILDDIAGIIDEETKSRLRLVIENLSSTAVIEATVDTPLVSAPDVEIELKL